MPIVIGMIIDGVAEATMGTASTNPSARIVSIRLRFARFDFSALPSVLLDFPL
jgi:hypothetical protein